MIISDSKEKILHVILVCCLTVSCISYAIIYFLLGDSPFTAYPANIRTASIYSNLLLIFVFAAFLFSIKSRYIRIQAALLITWMAMWTLHKRFILSMDAATFIASFTLPIISLIVLKKSRKGKNGATT